MKLSEIATNWDELLAAHADELSEYRLMQARVLQQYFGAVWAYLNGAVNDVHVADDLAQEFAYRFLRGDFRHVHPSRGRFRDLIKVVLRNLIIDHYRRHSSRHSNEISADRLASQAENQSTPPEVLEDLFQQRWRRDLLKRSWRRFRRNTRGRRLMYYQVLRLHLKNPRIHSSDMAQQLSQCNQHRYTAVSVRQILHRSRRMFAECLRDEVRYSLIEADDDMLADELNDLNLSKYVKLSPSHKKPK